MSSEYKANYASSQSDPDGFWLSAAQALEWERAPGKGWSAQDGWFADGVINTCHNAVDRHVAAGRGDQTAVIYESPVTGRSQRFSYAELRDEVAQVAGMLSQLGVAKGDRVVIYMPMIPETLFAMLACARIGAIHSVVFGGFAAPELAKRIDDAKPKLLLTASCGIEGQKVIPYKPLVDHALELAAHSIDHVVLLQRPQLTADMTAGRDLDWQIELAKAQPVGCVPVASTDPLYILYTSGTTGTPKGVLIEHRSIVNLVASDLAEFNLGPGDRVAQGSSPAYDSSLEESWLALASGATLVVMDDAAARLGPDLLPWLQRERISVFCPPPTILRTTGSTDPARDLPLLKLLYVGGEALPQDLADLWARGRRLVNGYGPTECTVTVVRGDITPGRPVTIGTPVPGHSAFILDQDLRHLAFDLGQGGHQHLLGVDARRIDVVVFDVEGDVGEHRERRDAIVLGGRGAFGAEEPGEKCAC